MGLDSSVLRSEAPTTEIALPWSAWFRDETHYISIPSSFSVDVLEPRDGPALSSAGIASSLDTPIESETLAELAAAGRTACVAIDDLSRPTKVADVLPKLLDQLQEGGIGPSATTIVVATGTHGGLDSRAIGLKIGEAVIPSQIRIEVHEASSSVAASGIQYGNCELRINRTFLDADVKVGVGCVLPHSFAGYSGGAKVMLPGLADVDATARSHKFVQMGLRGGQDPNENRFRLEIEKLAWELGYRYTVCMVPNRWRETAGVFAGHLVSAHRAAFRLARKTYATRLDSTYDCLVLNAYPKDTDLIQSEAVTVALKTARSPILNEHGVMVIATAASQGLGHHGLFAPGGKSYREPKPRRNLGNREVWIYAPNVSEADVHKLYWRETRAFTSAPALADALSQRLPRRAAVAVLPCAPMQQIDDHRETPSTE